MSYSLCWIPACLRMMLAMLREVTVTATLNFLLVIGLNQNSWLPLAWRDNALMLKKHLSSFRS